MGFGAVHTIYSEEGWRNTLEGAAPLAGVYETKEEAVDAGRAQAENLQTEHLIHSEDGTIVERHSYGARRLAG
jgi:Uncharacterized protein conserved in bacteria (DUF2188)